MSSTTIYMYSDEELHQNEEDEDDYPVIVEYSKSGYNCKKCGELFPFAEPNQKDGTLICYSCRNYG